MEGWGDASAYSIGVDEDLVLILDKELEAKSELSLNGMQLTCLDGLDRLERLRDVTTLDVCNNNLRNLSGAAAVPKLCTIVARANKLKSDDMDQAPLPDTVQDLDFSHNLLTRLPRMNGLKSLVSLNLSWNRIEMTCDAFTHVLTQCGSDQLTVFDMSFNNLEWTLADFSTVWSTLITRFSVLSELAFCGNPFAKRHQQEYLNVALSFASEKLSRYDHKLLSVNTAGAVPSPARSGGPPSPEHSPTPSRDILKERRPRNRSRTPERQRQRQIDFSLPSSQMSSFDLDMESGPKPSPFTARLDHDMVKFSGVNSTYDRSLVEDDLSVANMAFDVSDEGSVYLKMNKLIRVNEEYKKIIRLYQMAMSNQQHEREQSHNKHNESEMVIERLEEQLRSIQRDMTRKKEVQSVTSVEHKRLLEAAKKMEKDIDTERKRNESLEQELAEKNRVLATKNEEIAQLRKERDTAQRHAVNNSSPGKTVRAVKKSIEDQVVQQANEELIRALERAQDEKNQNIVQLWNKISTLQSRSGSSTPIPGPLVNNTVRQQSKSAQRSAQVHRSPSPQRTRNSPQRSAQVHRSPSPQRTRNSPQRTRFSPTTVPSSPAMVASRMYPSQSNDQPSREYHNRSPVLAESDEVLRRSQESLRRSEEVSVLMNSPNQQARPWGNDRYGDIKRAQPVKPSPGSMRSRSPKRTEGPRARSPAAQRVVDGMKARGADNPRGVMPDVNPDLPEELRASAEKPRTPAPAPTYLGWKQSAPAPPPTFDGSYTERLAATMQMVGSESVERYSAMYPPDSGFRASPVTADEVLAYGSGHDSRPRTPVSSGQNSLARTPVDYHEDSGVPVDVDAPPRKAHARKWSYYSLG